jgi:hypothetical protein
MTMGVSDPLGAVRSHGRVIGRGGLCAVHAGYRASGTVGPWDIGLGARGLAPSVAMLDTMRDRVHGGRYNRRVSRFYSLDDANALVPDLATVTARLRDLRAGLVGLRDAYRDRESVLIEDLIAEEPAADGDDPELRRLRLRMRGLVDQMQADVAWLDERAIVLRDIPSGLLDFPALVSGQEAWLCWRLGEDRVGWWHRTDEGFDRRRPLAVRPDDPARA